jgi:hypothetical protein
MYDLIDEIVASHNSGIYAPALITALGIPETLGVLAFPDLSAADAYDRWYDERVGVRHGPAPGAGGALLRAIRDSLLHADPARFLPFGFARVAFYEPVGTDSLNDGVADIGGEAVLQLRIDTFINDIINAARTHMDELGRDHPGIAGLLSPRLEPVAIPAGNARLM